MWGMRTRFYREDLEDDQEFMAAAQLGKSHEHLVVLSILEDIPRGLSEDQVKLVKAIGQEIKGGKQ